MATSTAGSATTHPSVLKPTAWNVVRNVDGHNVDDARIHYDKFTTTAATDGAGDPAQARADEGRVLGAAQR